MYQSFTKGVLQYTSRNYFFIVLTLINGPKIHGLKHCFVDVQGCKDIFQQFLGLNVNEFFAHANNSKKSRRYAKTLYHFNKVPRLVRIKKNRGQKSRDTVPLCKHSCSA